MPQFADKPRCSMAQVSVANPNRDGSGTIVNVFTAGSNGSRIEAVVIQATGDTTAGMVRLFINDGTNTGLFLEISISAVTVSSSVPAFRSEVSFNNLILPYGYSLMASTHNSQTFNIIIFGGDF